VADLLWSFHRPPAFRVLQAVPLQRQSGATKPLSPSRTPHRNGFGVEQDLDPLAPILGLFCRRIHSGLSVCQLLKDKDLATLPAQRAFRPKGSGSVYVPQRAWSVEIFGISRLEENLFHGVAAAAQQRPDPGIPEYIMLRSPPPQGDGAPPRVAGTPLSGREPADFYGASAAA